MSLTNPVIVIHYNEIATKGENRIHFEKALVDHINKKLAGITAKKAKRNYGKIILDANNEKIIEVLKKIPGIQNIGIGFFIDLDLKKIEKILDKVVAKKETYRISTKRQNKKFELTSPEVNKKLADYLISKGFKADITKFTKEIFIEICSDKIYIFFDKITCLGGLPITKDGKVLSLLSGGIDSPVASYLISKRGTIVHYIHFFNDTINSRAALDKIKKLVTKLTEYQLDSKLYIVPFKDLQKEIILKIPSKYRMLVYKRYMFKIANALARKENYKALITGDNLGQVASQTLDNIKTTYSASSIPVLHPLIGFDKLETIDLAKRIGTYEISILPYEDCCSLLVSQHPETRSKLEDLERMEKEINLELIKEAIRKIEKIKF